MTPRFSEAFRRWRSTPLSTPYPPTTSESSSDSSSERPLDLSSLSAEVQRFKPEDSREEHMEIGTADAEAVTDLGIGDGVDTKDGIGMGVEIAASDIRDDEEEFEAEASAGGTIKIDVDPLVTGGNSESTIGDVLDLEEAGQLMASGDRVGLTDRIRRLGQENLRDMTITRSRMTPKAIEELIAQRVAEALANYEATCAANALEAESQSQNGSDGDNGNGNGGNRNGNHGDGGNNENGNPNENGRGFTRWFEKMEIVFHISNCPEVYQVKYVTCTLLDSALTWWNSHKRTIGVDVAFAMTWRDLMKLMTEVYCPRNEIQKMETELWNLTVKNNDLAAYTQRFQELTLLCTRMVPGEEDQIESLRAIKEATVHNKPPFKRQNVGGSNVAKAHMAGGNEGRVYVGPHPLCNKFKLHHVGPCTVKCRSYGKIGDLTRDCKLAVPAEIN
ncbi:putative reverse transcriptase domain-containing protein [Tanacetum coccineum]